jgi:hypothetical protein
MVLRLLYEHRRNDRRRNWNALYLPSKMAGIIPFHFFQVTSPGRLKPKQESGLYPAQIQSPEFRAVGVIAAVPF